MSDFEEVAIFRGWNREKRSVQGFSFELPKFGSLGDGLGAKCI